MEKVNSSRKYCSVIKAGEENVRNLAELIVNGLEFRRNLQGAERLYFIQESRSLMWLKNLVFDFCNLRKK